MNNRTKSGGFDWWDVSWNPVTGCSPISPGCDNCYAAAMSKRFYGNFNVTLHPERIDRPLSWRKPKLVFVCNMGDLFHEDVPFAFIDRVFAVMAALPKHTFCLLTKRPERMSAYIDSLTSFEFGSERDCNLYDLWRVQCALDEHQLRPSFPIPNIWLGVTAENQEQANKRVPVLLKTPAAKRFVSVEPMLERVDFAKITLTVEDGYFGDCLRWYLKSNCAVKDYPTIDWVICGGESGPGARPMNPQWARDLRDQCVNANVPFYFKQNGEYVSVSEVEGPGAHYTFDDARTVRRTGKRRAGRTLDGKEWNQIPEGK